MGRYGIAILRFDISLYFSHPFHPLYHLQFNLEGVESLSEFFSESDKGHEKVWFPS